MSSFEYEKVLTTGASGMIGSYVDFGMRPTRYELDILDEESVMAYVTKHKPRAIIHLAGATDMARTERDPLYAYELNVRGTYNVAHAARAVGATLVYASTSRIFGGDASAPYTEEDVPEPKTHYGRTKHIGEIIAASFVPECIIARTSWVFGGGPQLDNKFYGNVLKQLQSEDDIVALNDVIGSPTYGKDYVSALKELLATEKYGVFHIANAGTATRFDIASAMASQIKPAAVIRAVPRRYFESGENLPTNESISSKHVTLRPWREALAEYLRNEWQPYL